LEADLCWNEVEALAAVATTAVTAFGLFFVWLQVRAVQRTVRSDTNARFCEQSLTIMSFIADRPHLYPYFYDSKQLGEDDPYRVDVLCLAEMMANYADLVLGNLSDVEKSVRDRWTSYVRGSISSSPVLTSFIAERQSWYSKCLVELTQSL
jgi:hypothetical protein